MGVTRGDIPYALTSGVRALFMQEMTEVPGLWPMFATAINSTKDKETYGWLNQISMPRLFEDERTPRGLTEQAFEVVNLKWENTLEISRDAFDDDQTGGLNIRVRDLARRAVQHIDKTVCEALEDGDENTCYDGQYFFDTDHVDVGAEYTTDQSNKLSLEFSEPNLETAINTMCGFKDDRGIPAGMNPTVIFSGPNLRFPILKVLKATNLAGGMDNDYNAVRDMNLTYVMMPWMRDTSRWGLLDTSGVVKPMLMQMRDGPEFSSLMPQNGMETYESFMRDRYLWGTRFRGAVVYGNWRMALASDPSW